MAPRRAAGSGRPPRVGRGERDRAPADPPPDGGEVLYGLHPIVELLERRPSAVERVYVSREPGPRLGRVLRLARHAGIPVTRLPRDVLARKVGAGARHQGVAAVVAPVEYAEVDSLCRRAAERPDGLLVVLDRVVDPRNLGSVVRTVAAAGGDGVIVSGEGTVGLTPAAVKSSAGAVERCPVAREAHPGRRLGALKELGFRVVGLEPRAGVGWDAVALTGRIVVVAGGEQRGLRPSLSDGCDERVAIPLAEGIESLNVAVAVGVLLFEALRQRRAVERALETGPGAC